MNTTTTTWQVPTFTRQRSSDRQRRGWPLQIEERQHLAPRSCAPSLHRVGSRGLRAAAGFRGSYTADGYRRRRSSTEYRRDGPSDTSPM